MTAKINTLKKSSAAQGLEELIEMGNGAAPIEAAAAAAPLQSTTIGTSTVDSYDGEELQSTKGQGPRVSLFYTHEAYDGMDETKNAVVQPGDVFDGTYEGSFVSGQYNSRKHKITLKSGITIALPPCGKLDSEFQRIPSGTRTAVRYDGRATKADVGPDWKGQLPYRYDVALPPSVNAQVKAGTLPTLYELKKKDSTS